MGKDKAAGQAQKPTTASAPEKATRCVAQSCKRDADRFDFCAEHYEHFKFGLITRLGKPVSDYDKKIDHYHAYVARTASGRKAA